MLNYTRTSQFFIGLLIISISLDYFYSLPAMIYLILYLLYSAIFFYGVFSIQSNFFIPVACVGINTQKEIAISFDDGPSTQTLDILKILNTYQVSATFFCIGKHISGNESILQQIHQQGHIIGNHSDSHHLLFDLFLSQNMLKDMQKMDQTLFDAVGLKPRLFRPPFGVINPCLKNAIAQGDYMPIGWSVRSLDTVAKNEQQLLSKVVAALHPGAIYLFHDTQAITRAILPSFIQQAHANGYKIVNLDKLLNITPYKNG